MSSNECFSSTTVSEREVTWLENLAFRTVEEHARLGQLSILHHEEGVATAAESGESKESSSDRESVAGPIRCGGFCCQLC